MVKANDASKNYGQSISLSPSAFTSTGLVNGDTILSVSESSAGSVASAGVLGSPYPIIPSDATGSFSASNYTLSYVNGALSILPIPLQIKANDATKNYGQSMTLATSTFTTAGLVNGDTVISVNETSAGTAATANVIGSPYAITPSNASGTFTASNYTLSYIDGALTVVPVPLVIRANDTSKSYGQTITLPLTAFTSSGLVNGDTVNSVTETSPGTVATASVLGSPYAITPSAATGNFIASNYTLTYVNGALVVTPIPLIITANNASKNYGETITFPKTAFTANGLANGDTIVSVNESSAGSVATANVHTGPYAIVPSGASGSFTPSNYTLSYVNGVLTVLPIPLVITANDASKYYGQTITLPLTAFTTRGLVNGDTVNSVHETSPGTPASANVLGSPYPITPSDATGSFTPTNYVISYSNGSLKVIPLPITVTASDATKPYGSTIELTEFTQSGLLGGETITKLTLTSPGTVASASVVDSPYVITPSNPTGATFTPTNYDIHFVPGELSVTPPISIIPPTILTPIIPTNPNVVTVDIVYPQTPTGLETLLVPEPSKPVLEVIKPTPSKVLPPKPIVKAAPPFKKVPERPRKQDRH